MLCYLAAARSPRLGEVVTIDAIVWDGLEDMRDDLDIVFLELTGQARLNDRQRRIQDAAEAGRVRFAAMRHDRSGLLMRSRSAWPPKKRQRSWHATSSRS